MKIYTKALTALASSIVLMASMPAHSSDGVVFDPVSNTVTFHCDILDTDGLRDLLAYVEFASDTKGPKNPDGDGRDRAGLKGKLSNADLKLLEDPPKPCDAAQKLDDFSAKVAQLDDANTGDKMKIWETKDPDGTGAIQCLIDGSAAYAASLRDGQDCSDGGSGGGKGKGPNK